MTNIQGAYQRAGSAPTIPLTKNLNWRNNLTYMAEANTTTGANLLSTPKLSWYSALGWQVNDQLFGEYPPSTRARNSMPASWPQKPTPSSTRSCRARSRRTGPCAAACKTCSRGPCRRPGRLLRAGTPYVCRPDVALLTRHRPAACATGLRLALLRRQHLHGCRRRKCCRRSWASHSPQHMLRDRDASGERDVRPTNIRRPGT